MCVSIEDVKQKYVAGWAEDHEIFRTSKIVWMKRDSDITLIVCVTS